jgi:hypothetical protein
MKKRSPVAKCKAHGARVCAPCEIWKMWYNRCIWLVVCNVNGKPACRMEGDIGESAKSVRARWDKEYKA